MDFRLLAYLHSLSIMRGGHQRLNAEVLVKNAQAYIIEEENLTYDLQQVLKNVKTVEKKIDFDNRDQGFKIKFPEWDLANEVENL